MSRLELTTFGVPHIKIDGRSIEALSSRKAQALLIYLAVTRHQHSRQALAGLLWGEMSEEKARRNLRVTLTRIRVPLENHLIIRRRSLLVDIDEANDVWLDVNEFESCLAPANPALEQLQRAAALYRGHFLDDFALRDAPLFEEWVRPLQERYRQMAMEAIYRLAHYYTEQKQYSTAITFANRLLRLEPWMEEAHRQLMLLLALSGQRSAALTQYESCCEMLLEELSVAPAAATVALYEQILREEIQPDTQPISVETSTPVRAAPIQIPAAVKHFVGRSTEAAAMEKALCAVDSLPVQALVGMGGIGKSALAIQLARAVQKAFPDGVLWANVASSEPMAILESWAAAYGYDFTRIADLESMAAAFRGVLAEKRVLIVLDDVTSVSRIRPLLPGGEQCKVLLTTRDQDLARALNAQVWPLGELSLGNGRLLLSAILGQNRVAAETEAADEICTLLQNLPLALEITAQRLKSRPRRQLAEMAERLRDETQRLSLLKISDREVRASFAVSWGALDAERQRIFALIGLFNGRSFTAEAMAHITNMAQYPAEDRLFDLVNLSLLREEEGRRYRQHPLLADFAREQLGEDEAEGYGRLAAYYLHFAQQNRHDYDALRPEWDNLMAAMAAAHAYQLWQTVIGFAGALHDAWFTRGRFSQARLGYKWAIAAAKAEQNVASQAHCLRQRGLAALEQRDFEAAEQHLIQSTQLYESLNDTAVVAQNQCDLARIAIEQSNYTLARQYLQTSQATREMLNDWAGLAETLHVEARMHYFRGQHDETVHLGEQALNILASHKKEEKGVRTLSLLASAFIMQQQFDTAKSYAQQALELSEKLQDKGDKGVILGVLSYIAYKQNDLDTAQAYGEQSLSLLQNIGDLGSQALTYYQLGKIYLAKKEPQLGLEVGLRSLVLCRQSQFSLQQGWTLTHLAECYDELGEAAQAEAHWQEVRELAQRLQNPSLLDYVKKKRPINHLQDSVQDLA